MNDTFLNRVELTIDSSTGIGVEEIFWQIEHTPPGGDATVFESGGNLGVQELGESSASFGLVQRQTSNTWDETVFHEWCRTSDCDLHHFSITYLLPPGAYRLLALNQSWHGVTVMIRVRDPTT